MKLRWSRVLFLTVAKSAFYIVIFLAGLGIGLLYNDVPTFTWKREFSLGDISSIILAVITPLWVPFYLDRKISNKRAGKDMIIDSCLNHEKSGLNSLENLVNEVMAQGKNISVVQATKIIQETSRLSSRLSLLIQDVEIYRSDTAIKSLTKALKTDQSMLWLELTANLKDKSPKIIPANYHNTTQILYVYLRDLSKLKVLVNES